MNAKQQRFVEEYLIDLNGAQAAIRAGYSAKTAAAIATELLRNPTVRWAVELQKAARSERTLIDADWVLKRLYSEATADIGDIFDAQGGLRPIAEWPLAWRTGLVVGVESYEEFSGTGKQRKVVGTVRKVKLSDRVRHVELIGKHVTVGAFRELHGHSGPNGGPIPVEHKAAVTLSDDQLARIAAGTPAPGAAPAPSPPDDASSASG